MPSLKRPLNPVDTDTDIVKVMKKSKQARDRKAIINSSEEAWLDFVTLSP